MANMQKDPLQSITLALQPIFANFGVLNTQLGWPDTKFFTADGNLPAVAIVSAGGNAKNIVSRETVHAIVQNGNGTATAYYEKLRLFYLLQISLFTYTPQDRSNIGWNIEQYLVTNPQLQFGIPGVETAIFLMKSIPHDDEGETNFYQRDLTFQVQARVLDAETAQVMKTLQMNDHTTGTTMPSSPANPSLPAPPPQP